MRLQIQNRELDAEFDVVSPEAPGCDFEVVLHGGLHRWLQRSGQSGRSLRLLEVDGAGWEVVRAGA